MADTLVNLRTKLLTWVKTLVPERKAFDPTILRDPLAVKTSWEPASTMGTNICTHRLKMIHSGLLEFRITARAISFCMIFLLIGVALFIFGLIEFFRPQNPHRSQDGFLIGFGAFFGGAGAWMLSYIARPTAFLKTAGIYYKGKKPSPTQMHTNPSPKNYGKLEDIYAVQVISKICSGNKSSYQCYEINFIFKDAQRINILIQGNKQAAIEDSQKLADFLDVPCWSTLSSADG